MTVAPAGLAASPVSSPLEIKSAQLPLVAMMLRSADLAQLASYLARQYGNQGASPDFFDHDPLLLDFSQLPADAATDLPGLLALLRQHRLVPVAARGGSPELMTAAFEAGLAQAPDAIAPKRKTATRDVVEVVREVVREVPGPGTMVIDKPLRSGQKIYAKGCDLVVLSMVNQGAEVVADGNIHVYAPLRGKAMAGARGNTSARIFSICLEPELVSIAGIYRTSETALPDTVRGKPAQIRLAGDELDKLLIEPLVA